MKYQFYKIVLPSSEYAKAYAVFLHQYFTTVILWSGSSLVTVERGAFSFVPTEFSKNMTTNICVIHV
jgi:hypothetical protein